VKDDNAVPTVGQFLDEQQRKQFDAIVREIRGRALRDAIRDVCRFCRGGGTFRELPEESGGPSSYWIHRSKRSRTGSMQPCSAGSIWRRLAAERL